MAGLSFGFLLRVREGFRVRVKFRVRAELRVRVGLRVWVGFSVRVGLGRCKESKDTNMRIVSGSF